MVALRKHRPTPAAAHFSRAYLCIRLPPVEHRLPLCRDNAHQAWFPHQATIAPPSLPALATRASTA